VGVDHVDGAEIGVGAGGVGDPLHVSKRQHRSVRDGSVGPLATSVISSWNRRLLQQLGLRTARK
jgi:hypothetical protein